MKTKLLLLMVLVVSSLFAQKSNQIKFNYGYFGGDVLTFTALDCGGGGSQDSFVYHQFDIRYGRKLGKTFRIETGVTYLSAEIVSRGGSFSNKYVNSDDFQVIMIPINAVIEFGKYVYLNTGASLDFQLQNDVDYHSQSGLGLNLGAGGKYDYKNFTFFLGPEFKLFNVIPFEKKNHEESFYGLGLKFGIGYNF